MILNNVYFCPIQTNTFSKMKKYFYVSIITVISLGLFSFTQQLNNENKSEPVKGTQLDIPDNVQGVIEKSCFGCHNADSKNDKGKKKLQFDQLGQLKTHKLVGKLTDIADVVSAGDMPPEKFLSHKPEATPTAVEKKILAEWAENTAKQLSK